MSEGTATPAMVPVVESAVDNGAGTQDTTSVDGDDQSSYISPEEYAKLAKRKVKTKVDGKDVELTFEEMERGYSHNSAANKRMQEAAAERKAVAAEKAAMEKELAQLKDPKAVRAMLAKHLGEDGFSTLAHETVMEQLRKESMTPEEIKAEEDSRELNEYRTSKQKAAEEAKLAEQRLQ